MTKLTIGDPRTVYTCLNNGVCIMSDERHTPTIREAEARYPGALVVEQAQAGAMTPEVWIDFKVGNYKVVAW